ncbi:MAG: tail-specific protease [Chitinophagaceae bacterium]|nr:tail-specific protease [Chitinophagaceae bacterium]
MFSKKSLLIVLVLLLGGSIFFAVQSSSTRKEPGSRFERILQLIGEFLEEGHYNPKKIDDAFSKVVFAKFLKDLDGDKTYFLKADIDEFKKYETRIDDEIHGARLESFYVINNAYKKRMEEVALLYKEILQKPFDFSVDEKYVDDPDRRSYAKNEVERKEFWRLKLKYYTLDRYVDLVEQQEKNKGKEGYVAKTTVQMEKEAREKVLKTFDRMFDRFRNRFKDEDRFNYLVNGITETMDPHTSYLPPLEKIAFDEQMSAGEFFGIGASLLEEDGNIKITTIVPAGAAAKSGEIQVGDIVLKVAQGNAEPQDLTGFEVPDAVRLIRGKKGTEVRLTIKKPSGAIKVVTMIREKIDLEENRAKSTIIKGPDNHKIGYIYLPAFYADFQDANGNRCAQDVAKEIVKLKAESIDGLIIDLRTNGGGSLMETVEMVGLFIEEGPVVQVKSRDEAPTILRDRNKNVLWNGPLTVMVNEFSASASEIFAGAIQDYKRGVIVGSTSTYGKGTVQRNIELDRASWTSNNPSDLGNIKLTLQKFYRVTGASTQLKGVVPDIVLPDQYEYLKLREKDEPNALSWDEIGSAQYKTWKSDVDFNYIVQQSKQRVSQSPSFKLISEKSDWLGKYDDKHFSLKVDKFRQDKKVLGNTIQTIDSLIKLQTPLDVQNLEVDLAAIKGITSKEERNKVFINRLKTDIHLGETVNIMSDMIRQYFIAQNKQSARSEGK